MERAVVTGGLGFIGSHIAEHLAGAGYSVAILDNSRSYSCISAVRKEVEVFDASITQYGEVKRALKDARLVFHEAAMASVQQSLRNPGLCGQVNIGGTMNVLNAAKECGVKRVILASSSAVYGNNRPPLKESMRPDPLNPYAGSKLANEMGAARAYSESGLETVSLRYFNVYGPRQSPQSQYAAVIPRFISALKSSATPVIYGDGAQTRDFIYVKDVVRANLLAAEARSPALGKAFNIASGKPTSILSLLDKIGDALGKKPAPAFEPARPGEITHSYADTSLAEKALCFKAEWTLEDGLRETCSFVL